MTTIYLIRHAEAEGNLYRRAHGQYNSLITENGHRQIQALSQRFENIPVDAVWSSDLYRTMTTAQAILLPQNLSLNTHQGLREINMGVWEDKTWGQLQREYPEDMEKFSGSAWDWQVEHGETFEKVMDRVSKTISDLARKHPDQTIAIFCHGLAIRQFLAHVNAVPPEEWSNSPHGDNTSVTKLFWDGTQFSVEYASDSSHLSDEISTFARQSWWKKSSGGIAQEKNLWFQPVNGEEEEKLYQTAMLEIWGATPPATLHSKTVYLARFQEEIAGLLSLTDTGELSLLYLLPPYREQRLGLQLLGQAVSHARSRGGDRLTFPENPCIQPASGFFTHFGFQLCDNNYSKTI